MALRTPHGSPLLVQSDLEAFSTYTAMFLVALFSIWDCQCTQGLLCARNPLQPTLMGVDFAFQLYFWQLMTSFLYLVLFFLWASSRWSSLGNVSFIRRSFSYSLLDQGDVWPWGGQPCALTESWWVPSSWGSWLLLSSHHGDDHLDGGVGSPAAVDSHADGFCDGFTHRMNLCVIPVVPTLPKSYFTTLESVKCSRHELARHPILICSWFRMLLLEF